MRSIKQKLKAWAPEPKPQISDCSLRQGGSGAEFAFLGSRTCFSGDFISILKRISARNLKKTVFPSKNVVWRSKTIIFEKHVLLKKGYFFFELFPLFKGPGPKNK